ncbi:MAG: hypothetical protein JWN61_338 [Pseudonocardiales bacterium]|nr:hypothetical protein [Jatrophihabitantaceae bacterium]MCW2602203.1 hypothetical protein [Pseudonocardiales bacterium]
MSSARTTSTGISAAAVPFSLTGRVKAGLIVAIILGLGDLASILLAPTDTGQNDGPPLPVMILATVLGAVTLAAIWVAWRTGSRRALRVVAGTRILSALTSLPAFFVDIPAGLLVITAVGVVLTIVCLVLILAPSGPKPLPIVTD